MEARSLRRVYWECPGDLVSRLISPTTHVVTRFIPLLTHLLSLPDPPSTLGGTTLNPKP